MEKYEYGDEMRDIRYTSKKDLAGGMRLSRK